jgi:hypothetical protein
MRSGEQYGRGALGTEFAMTLTYFLDRLLAEVGPRGELGTTRGFTWPSLVSCLRLASFGGICDFAARRKTRNHA